MAPRKRRPRNRRRAQRLIFEDSIQVVCPAGASVTYKTTDVRFNIERPYRVSRAVLHLACLGANAGNVQVRLLNPDVDGTPTLASSGPITVGIVPQRVVVTMPRSVGWCEPRNTSTNLISVDGLCPKKITDMNYVGSMIVYIQYGREILSESCPTLTVSGLNRPVASSSSAVSFSDLSDAE